MIGEVCLLFVNINYLFHNWYVGNAHETNSRVVWNEFQKAFLVKFLVEFNKSGTRQQNVWSDVAWNDMARRFKSKFVDSSFSLKQFKEQERTLKGITK